MPASKNSIKPSSKTAVNIAETKPTIKRELSSTSLISNGIAKLSSLTPARDLTLGGRGSTVANKKVFLPNLNVVRNKNANVKTSKDTTISRGRGRGRGSDRGTRGASRGGRGGSSLIQTSGVFSEGAGAVTLRQTSRSSGYSRDVEDTPSAMRKPTLLESEKKLDVKAVLAKDIDILKSLDDVDEDVVEQKTDLDRMPVKLSEAKWKYIKAEIKLEPMMDAEIDKPEDAVAIASHMQALHVAQQIDQQNKPLPRYPQSLTELLANSQPQIFLMQLPDTLPCVEEDSDLKESSVNPSTSSSADTAKPASLTDRKKKTVKDNVLKKMEEGQVGRLIRYKSGKTKLVLGETFFDLDIGMETGFIQDLMSISCNRDERSGNMINLGPIQAKITATPDWEQLLNESTTNQRL